MSKILQIVLPFWVMAKQYAKKYTDSRIEEFIKPNYGLMLLNGELVMVVYNSTAITTSLTNGTFSLNQE